MTYNTKYYSVIRDFRSSIHTVYFQKKDYTGSTEQIVPYSLNPLSVNYRSASKDDDETICGSELNFNFYSLGTDLNKYDELFESSFRDWKVFATIQPDTDADIPALNTWTQSTTIDVNWTLGTSPSVTLTGLQGSEILSSPTIATTEIPAGNYTLNLDVDSTGTNGRLTIRFYDVSSNLLETITTDEIPVGNNALSVDVFLSAPCTKITVIGFHSSPVGSTTLTLNGLDLEAIETAYWNGWLQPDNLSRRYVTDQYFISASATCGLSELKNITYPYSGITGNTLTRQDQILKTILNRTGLELDIWSQVNLLHENMNTSDALFSETWALTNRFVKNEKNGRRKYLSCYDALNYILKSYYSRISQVNNRFSIVQKNEVDSQVTKYDISDLSFTRDSRDRTVNIDSYQSTFESDELSKAKPIKKINLTFFNKNYDNVLTNGRFDLNINGWTQRPFPASPSNTFTTFAWEAVPGDGGKMKLERNSSLSGQYGIASDPFFLDSRGGTGATLNVTVDFDLASFSNTSGNASRYFQIYLYSGNSHIYSGNTFLVSTLTPNPYLYSSKQQFTLEGDLSFTYSGFYYMKILMWFEDSRDWTQATVYLDNISAIQQYESDVTTDRFFTGEVDANYGVEEIEDEIWFADDSQNNDIGALKWSTSSTGQTTTWSNNDGSVENQKLAYLYLYEKLKSNLRFKNYLVISLKADINKINYDSVLELNSKLYRIVGMDYYVQDATQSLALVEILLDDFTMNFTEKSLESIDGEVD